MSELSPWTGFSSWASWSAGSKAKLSCPLQKHVWSTRRTTCSREMFNTFIRGCKQLLHCNVHTSSSHPRVLFLSTFIYLFLLTWVKNYLIRNILRRHDFINSHDTNITFSIKTSCYAKNKKSKKKLENQNLHYSGSSQSFTFIILQKDNKFQGIKPQFQTPGFNL